MINHFNDYADSILLFQHKKHGHFTLQQQKKDKKSQKE